MIGGSHPDRIVPADRREAERAIVVGFGEDRKVQRTFAESLCEHPTVLDGDRCLQLGILRIEPVEEVGQADQREGVGDPQPRQSAKITPTGDMVPEILHQPQDAFCIAHRRHPAFGQHGVPAHLLERAHAQGSLELLDAQGDRGLTDAKLGRGRPEAAEALDPAQSLQLADFAAQQSAPTGRVPPRSMLTPID